MCIDLPVGEQFAYPRVVVALIAGAAMTTLSAFALSLMQIAATARLLAFAAFVIVYGAMMRRIGLA